MTLAEALDRTLLLMRDDDALNALVLRGEVRTHPSHVSRSLADDRVGRMEFLLGLRRRHLVVAPVHQFLVDDVVDGIGAPGQRIDRAAARTAAAAPFIREQDLGAVIVERGGMPVGEALVIHRVEALRILGVIADWVSSRQVGRTMTQTLENLRNLSEA